MTRYDLARFRASHNSYSGHDRGSLVKQLNANVRCLEFDFHDNGFETFHDYRIGHLKVGAEVDHTPPNPPDSLLRSWLGVVASWSSANPSHTPVTIVFDAKDDLTDNTEGDLEDFNHSLESAFGRRLFTRGEFDRLGRWPSIEHLRGRIVCVLSGNGATRAAYRWAFGTTPALGANAHGDIVLAYRSTAGELNCWTGRADEAAGAIAWRRKSTLVRLDIDVAEPVLAINDDGWVVAVCRFGPRPGVHGFLLESKLGRLRGDGRITWHKTQIVSAGISPSLQLDGDDIVLIHGVEGGAGRWLVRGTIDRRTRKITWQKSKKTQRPLFSRAVAGWASHAVRASPDNPGAIGCTLDGATWRPVRFRQVAFVERQKGEDPRLFRDARFFAAGAANQAEIAQAREQGLVARAWGFTKHDKADPPGSPPENFPATDTPYQPWYRQYVP